MKLYGLSVPTVISLDWSVTPAPSTFVSPSPPPPPPSPPPSSTTVTLSELAATAALPSTVELSVSPGEGVATPPPPLSESLSLAAEAGAGGGGGGSGCCFVPVLEEERFAVLLGGFKLCFVLPDFFLLCLLDFDLRSGVGREGETNNLNTVNTDGMSSSQL